MVSPIFIGLLCLSLEAGVIIAEVTTPEKGTGDTTSDDTPLEFSEEPSNAKVIYGDSVIFKCKVANNISAVECIWVANKKKIIFENNANYSLTGDPTVGDCQLNIKAADYRTKDTAFFCGIRTSRGTLYSKSATLKVNVNMEFNYHLSETKSSETLTDNRIAIVVRNNTSILLTINAKNGYPKFNEKKSLTVKVNEIKSSDVVINVNDSKVLAETNNLEASVELHVADENIVVSFTLTHEAPLPMGQMMTKTIRLLVVSNPLPVLPVNALINNVGAWQSKLFAYTDAGKPQYTIMGQAWKVKDGDDWKTTGGETKFPEPPKKLGMYTYQFTVRQSSLYDIEAKSEELHLLVYEPMTRVNITSSLDVKLNPSEKAILTCEAEGYPPPEIRWVKATSDGIFHIKTGFNYTLGGSTDDVGKYKCDAVQSIFEQRVLKVAPSIVVVHL